VEKILLFNKFFGDCRYMHYFAKIQPRVGHGLDASMDWIGLDWIGLDRIGSNVGQSWMDWIGLDCGE